MRISRSIKMTSGHTRSALPGFTLLELSVVLFIMAVMLGIALPSFSNLMESDLEKEAQKLAAIIGDLRLKAILNSSDYLLVFDTKKSEYQVLVIDPADPSSTTPPDDYNAPIQLKPPVEIASISTDIEQNGTSRFGFKKMEFDKIFGQEYSFRIDSSGFIDMFRLRLKDRENSITLSIETIMGEIAIGQETPL